ncbi:hypothetical protein SSS_09940 [Sarcoptes scabiei]|nr:hypothetical protein SSS_09940 [Sarcoptes scabiei]
MVYRFGNDGLDYNNRSKRNRFGSIDWEQSIMKSLRCIKYSLCASLIFIHSMIVIAMFTVFFYDHLKHCPDILIFNQLCICVFATTPIWALVLVYKYNNFKWLWIYHLLNAFISIILMQYYFLISIFTDNHFEVLFDILFKKLYHYQFKSLDQASLSSCLLGLESAWTADALVNSGDFIFLILFHLLPLCWSKCNKPNF